MGNRISVDNEQSDDWWPPPRTNITETEAEQIAETNNDNTTETVNTENTESNSTNNEDDNDRNIHRRQNEIKLQQFKSDLEKKHLARREAIAERSREILFLREELIKYKKENEELKDLVKQNNESEESLKEQNIEEVKCELERLRNENEVLQNKISQLNEELNRSDELSKQNQDLRKSIAETQKDLQAINTQVVEYEKERHDYETHVVALKDVIRVSKKLLEIRENQLQDLKTKVADIETSLAEREVSMMSENLKDEYERQLENIRNLRALYEQRQAATKAERDLMASQLTDAKNILESEQKKNGELQERIDELENNVSHKYDEIKSLESQLGLAKAEFRGLETEMSAINQLFSQILYGFNNCQEIDFDKLIKLLEENHDLLTNIIVNEESESISSALPKVLLDLVNQVNEGNKTVDLVTESEQSTSNSSNETDTDSEEIQQPEQQCGNTMNSAEEIVNKLPKVWRVLTELLRQQSGQLPVDIKEDGTDPCYKSVETPKGPKMVLSVSQTFIRLKDLILEKKSLEKEMSRLKQLNTHLEVRLQDQEKRLETVSSELSKTWHVVGRMQRQHQQLHTHEKILRYELAQKRKMLTELKEELEYCREKWEQAREKNSNTEEEWKKLRTEFASRKTVVADELNNSAESGYSDERECSSDEEYNIDKRNKKLMNKIPVSEQTSDTDDAECNSSSTTEEPIANNMINNHRQEDNTQISEEPEKITECEDVLHSTEEQKTYYEVQNQSEKTVPASLDVIDNVCALGIEPVPVYVDETPSTNSSDETSSTNLKSKHTEKEISQDTELTRLEEQCQKPVPVSNVSTNHSSDETPSTSSCSNEISSTNSIYTHTDKEISQDERITRLEEQCEQSILVPNVSTNHSSDETPSTSSCSNEISSTNSTSTHTDKEISQDERLKRKDERLKRLEEQCKQLVTKVTNTTNRSTEICTRLETLHEQYGNDNARTNVQESDNTEDDPKQ